MRAPTIFYMVQHNKPTGTPYLFFSLLLYENRLRIVKPKFCLFAVADYAPFIYNYISE